MKYAAAASSSSTMTPVIGDEGPAYALYQAGRFADSAEYYRRLVKLYPSDVEMKAGLGWALLKQGNKVEARPLFADVLHVAPAHQSALAGAAEAK